jgi:hypothetical protein
MVLIGHPGKSERLVLSKFETETGVWGEIGNILQPSSFILQTTGI